jgi:hypothetical protein
MGMKEELKVSSVRVILKSIGNLKLIKKISAMTLVPMKDARKTSLTKPLILLNREKIEYLAVDFAMDINKLKLNKNSFLKEN